jgi:hypothetical protein
VLNEEEDPKLVLTEAECRRSEAEERLLYQTRVRLRRKSRAWIWWVVGTPVALLVAMGLFSFLEMQTTFTAGSECVLSSPPIVFSSPQAIEEFKSLSGRETGIKGALMEQRGEVFTVQPGTRVRVLEIDLDRRRVTVLEGTHQAQSGWVEMGWLR